MRIVVFLGSSDDVRVPPQRHHRTGRLRADLQVRRPDPAAAHALHAALAVKRGSEDVEVVTVLLGPAEDEAFLRDALAKGADEVVRVWDEECAGLRAPGKAAVLAAAARAVGCDAVFTGAAGAATASAQVGVLASVHLGLPCVTQAMDLEVSAPGSAVATGERVASGSDDTGVAGGAHALESATSCPLRVTRALAGGYREIVEVTPPAVVTFVPAELDPRPAPIEALLEAASAEVPVWDLARLGVPREVVRRAEEPLRYGPLRTPKPALRALPAPDPSAPAFDRIGELVRGTVRLRGGRVVHVPADEAAEELFELLRAGGWLDHLRGGEEE